MFQIARLHLLGLNYFSKKQAFIQTFIILFRLAVPLEHNHIFSCKPNLTKDFVTSLERLQTCSDLKSKKRLVHSSKKPTPFCSDSKIFVQPNRKTLSLRPDPYNAIHCHCSSQNNNGLPSGFQKVLSVYITIYFEFITIFTKVFRDTKTFEKTRLRANSIRLL